MAYLAGIRCDEAFGGPPPGLAVCRLVVRDRPGAALRRVASRTDDLLLVGARPRRRDPTAGGRHGARVARHLRRHAACALRIVVGPARPTGVRRALRRLGAADFAA